MSRTAHHIRPSHGEEPAPGRPAGNPWHALVLHDLRFSARSLANAERKGTRPRPIGIRRQVEVHSFPRHNRDTSVAPASTIEERRARQLLRDRIGAYLALLYPAGRPPVTAVTGADAEDGVVARAHAVDVDVPPARHRHGALWHA